MKLIVVITADARLSSQIDQWVRMHMADKACVETHASLDAYKATLETPKEAAPAPVKDGGKDGAPKSLGLFIVDTDAIQGKPVVWFGNLQKLVKDGIPDLVSGGAPKVLALGHPSGLYKPESFQVDFVDDMALKPVDRTLLLQKIEFLISDDQKPNPSFLFRAKTSQTIELGTSTVVDEIAEIGIAFHTAQNLSEGAFVSIHSDVFSTTGSKRLLARVQECVPNPQKEGEFLARCTYFGISQEQLSSIRRYIQAHQGKIALPARPKSVIPAAPAAEKKGIPKAILDKMAALMARKIAIIDLNPDSLNETKSILESNFKDVPIRTFPSFSRLAAELRKLIPQAAPAAPAAAPAAPAGAAPAQGASAAKPGAKAAEIPAPEPAFPKGNRLAVVLRGSTYLLVGFEPALTKTDNILGRPVAEWLEKADQWIGSVAPEDRESFGEFLSFVEGGSHGKSVVRMKDAVGNSIHFKVDGRLAKSSTGEGTALLRLELEEINETEWAKLTSDSPGGPAQAPKDASAFRFEAVIIDAGFLRPDPKAWYEKFIALLQEAKVLGPNDRAPRVFVLSDAKSEIRLDEFRFAGIQDVLTRPTDRRYLTTQFRNLFPSLVPAGMIERPDFIGADFKVILGSEVLMEEISEYGLVIQYPSAIPLRLFLPFFSPTFGRNWVWGRCHSTEKAAEGANQRCQFMFFGPSDEVLQPIRRWVKEDYIAQKNASQG